jgi:hypothetical protein
MDIERHGVNPIKSEIHNTIENEYKIRVRRDGRVYLTTMNLFYIRILMQKVLQQHKNIQFKYKSRKYIKR